MVFNLFFISLSLSLLFWLIIEFFNRARAQVIDFSIPYFHSGVSLLASPKTKSEIPLLAFLLPFSPELWIAIFTSLNITAVAVAVYEWLSPFGLNPWGRQRSKNFSLSSGELCKKLPYFWSLSVSHTVEIFPFLHLSNIIWSINCTKIDNIHKRKRKPLV